MSSEGGATALAISDRSESPIEAAMLSALLNHFTLRVEGAPENASLYQQFEIDIPWHVGIGGSSSHSYRVDFAVFVIDGDGDEMVRAAIEVDGYEWHQKTRQQVERDYRRDRELHALGWIVLRFSGSEVHHDARACASEVVSVVNYAANRIADRYRQYWEAESPEVSLASSEQP